MLSDCKKFLLITSVINKNHILNQHILFMNQKSDRYNSFYRIPYHKFEILKINSIFKM